MRTRRWGSLIFGSCRMESVHLNFLFEEEREKPFDDPNNELWAYNRADELTITNLQLEQKNVLLAKIAVSTEQQPSFLFIAATSFDHKLTCNRN